MASKNKRKRIHQFPTKTKGRTLLENMIN